MSAVLQAAVADTEKTIKRREDQLRKLEASREELQVEEARLSQSDSLASVDAPMDSDAASVGERASRILCTFRLYYSS